MIKINLAKRKTAGFAGAEGILAKLNLSPDDLRELPLARIGLTLIAMILASSVISKLEERKVNSVVGQIDKLKKDQIKLRQEAAKVAGFEPIKKQLEKDEFALRTKIDTIQQLVSNRNEIAKMLIALSKLTPERVWLEKFTAQDGKLSIQGKSVGLSTVSDFMKRLRESAYFKEVTLEGTEQEDDVTGLEMAKFRLTAVRMSGAK